MGWDGKGRGRGGIVYMLYSHSARDLCSCLQRDMLLVILIVAWP
jgi:hypothetical protein